MTTIKAYTDISQSKKLAEILPLESADMHFINDKHAGCVPYFEMINDSNPWSKGLKISPCWSLASLLGVLPYCPDLSKHTDGKWYITTYPNDVHTCLMAYDNPVDACYEMVIKLKELNLL